MCLSCSLLYPDLRAVDGTEKLLNKHNCKRINDFTLCFPVLNWSVLDVGSTGSLVKRPRLVSHFQRRSQSRGQGGELGSYPFLPLVLMASLREK